MSHCSADIECLNAFAIGNVNFIIVKNNNNEISEKMMSNEEINDSSIRFVNRENCCKEIKDYLEGN